MNKGIYKKLYFVLFICIFFLEFAIMKNVSFMGDDLYYLTYADSHGKDFWLMHLWHYNNANGRAIVHILLTLFMKIPKIWWMILNAGALSLIAVYTTSFLNKNGDKFFSCITILMTFGLFLSLDKDITRESVYWMCGSFNYVYPYTLALLFFFVTFHEDAKGRKYFLPAIGFFSAATTEQNGMITLGIIVLALVNRTILKKEKAKKEEWITLFLVVVGMVSVYFAPAFFARCKEESAGQNVNFLKAAMVLFANFVTKKYSVLYASVHFLATGMFIYAHSFIKNRKVIVLQWISYIEMLAALVAVFYFFYAPKIPLMLYLPFTALCFFAGTVTAIVLMLINKPDHYFQACTAAVLSVGSQFMMSVSPVNGPRTTLCGLFMLFLFDCILISHIKKNTFFKTVTLCVSVFMLINGWNMYTYCLKGYADNLKITEINEEKISEFKENPCDELQLYKNINEDCAWSAPYKSSYHFYYYKLYHGLDNDVNITWRDFE